MPETRIPTPDRAEPLPPDTFAPALGRFLDAEQTSGGGFAGPGIAAVKDMFGTDTGRFCSAMWRIHALVDLIGEGGLDGWEGAAMNDAAMHPAVVAAAAETRLNRHGRFSARGFLKQVKKNARKTQREKSAAAAP